MSELGFHSPGKSFLHRAHPAVKIIVFALAVTFMPLVFQKWQSNLLLIVVLMGTIAWARIGRKQLLYFTPAIGLIVIAAVSWLFTNIGGDVVFEYRLGRFVYVLRDRSLQQAVTMSTRAAIWVLAYMALLTTTNTRELMAGLEAVFREHASEGKVAFEYETQVHIGRLGNGEPSVPGDA